MSTETIDALNTALTQAERLESSGRQQEAEVAYRRMIAAFPGQPIIYNRLGLLLKARGALTEAESLLRRAIMMAPNEAALHNNLGNVLRRADRHRQAEESYRKALSLSPSYTEAHYNLGVVLEDQSRADEALGSYARAVELQPDHLQAMTRIGAIHHSQRRYGEAVVALDEVLSRDPQSFEALYYKGLSLTGLERFDEALGLLRRAQAVRPESFEVALAIANNLRIQDRNNEALDAYWHVLELQPGFAGVHTTLNQLAWTTGRTDKFLTSFAYARERVGDDANLLIAEAQLRLQRNEPVQAEPLLRRALELEPGRAEAHGLLGRLLSRTLRFDESFERFSDAVRADPAAANYRNEFGYALLQGKQPRQALEQFDAARLMNANDQLALGGLSLAYRALGDSRYHALVDQSLVRVYPLRLPTGYQDVAAFNEALARELLTLHTMTSEPLDQTLRGGSQTPGLLFLRKSKIIEQVRDLIHEAVADYVRQMPFDPSHPLLSRKQDQFSFTHSWSCKLRSAGFHTNHVHPMGWISSAYYVSLPDALEDQAARQGWLKFGESHLELGGDDRPEHFVKPVVGHLALFPSYFWHGTVPFESSDDRLTIAFDVMPGYVDPSTISPGPY